MAILQSGTSPRDEVRRIFDAQAAKRWTVSRRSAAERVAGLKRLRDAIRARKAELCAAIQEDFGKHPTESEMTELLPVIEDLSAVIRGLPDWMRPRRVATPLPLLGSRSRVVYEAKGLVLVLSPWNYPFLLALGPVVSALAAGNCVILRPSEKTPRTARFIHDLLGSLFPEDEVAVILGDRAVADALLDLPFDHMFFTGSPAVGRKVMACAAKHLASVTLELGGKSPAIVDASADVEVAAQRIAWGKFINAGQTCVAPDYVLVHASVAGALEAALRRAVERSYGATEELRFENRDLACLVDSASCARLERAVRETLQAGARLVVGGRADAAARRMVPTILADVPDPSPIMAEEIFGPVLPLVPFRDLDEAIGRIRARPKPLAMYVFSRTPRDVDHLLGATSAGGTCVNNAVVHLANPYLPFGGVGESGMGHYHGRFGFEALSHARAVLTQTLPTAASLLYPPYGARARRVMALLLRLVGG
jgi:aldehyde dehydrogenase (NAD+)